MDKNTKDTVRKAQEGARECGCGCPPSDWLPDHLRYLADAADQVVHIQYVMGAGDAEERYQVTVTDHDGDTEAAMGFPVATYATTEAPALDWAWRWVGAWYPLAEIRES